MKTRNLILAGSLLVTGTAFADNATFYDHARVIEARPVYETVRVSTPREVCEDRQVPVRAGQRNTYTSVILGGIVGGALGSELVHGKHKDWGTAAGALLGGALGNDYYNRYQAPRSGYVTERSCRTLESFHEEQRLGGYEVTYRYQGRDYRTFLDHDPGKRVRVAVSVDVAE